MLPYRAVLGQKNALGQFEGLTGGLTSSVAREIVRQAEPVVREVVRDERNRFAEALIGGIPFAMLASMGYVATRYLAPDDSSRWKAIGYIGSAGAAGIGAWYTFSRLTEQAPEAPAAGPSSFDPVAQAAAQAIVKEADPKIRALVDEERARLAAAGKIFVPFAVGSLATLLATFFMVGDEKPGMKALGYTGGAALAGVGAWLALDREMAAA